MKSLIFIIDGDIRGRPSLRRLYPAVETAGCTSLPFQGKNPYQQAPKGWGVDGYMDVIFYMLLTKNPCRFIK